MESKGKNAAKDRNKEWKRWKMGRLAHWGHIRWACSLNVVPGVPPLRGRGDI